MKSFANYMIVMLMGLFWIFRLVVAVTATTGSNFIIKPMDNIIEIALLFISLICIVLVIKRKIFGGILYLVSFLAYFGVDLFNNAIKPLISGNGFTMANGFTTFISLLAVILSIVVMIDLLSDKAKKPVNKQTEWFYDNKDFDRQLDDRADKNNYRTL